SARPAAGRPPAAPTSISAAPTGGATTGRTCKSRSFESARPAPQASLRGRDRRLRPLGGAVPHLRQRRAAAGLEAGQGAAEGLEAAGRGSGAVAPLQRRYVPELLLQRPVGPHVEVERP